MKAKIMDMKNSIMGRKVVPTIILSIAVSSLADPLLVYQIQ